jgi:hypothetical protein
MKNKTQINKLTTTSKIQNSNSFQLNSPTKLKKNIKHSQCTTPVLL